MVGGEDGTEPAFSGKFEPGPPKPAAGSIPRIPDGPDTRHNVHPEGRRDPPPRAARAAFTESARPATEKDVRPDLARVVEKVWVDDVEATYDRLEAALRAGEKRSERPFLHEALDDSSQNYYLAQRLSATAKLERSRWELENAVVFADMRSKAIQSLNEEKDDRKARGEPVGKAISEADVEMRASVLFHEKWKEQKMHRERVERTVDLLEQLASAWQFRCNALRDMIKA